MKNSITNIFIIILCLIFVAIHAMKKPEPYVLKVVTPTVIQVDLNNNGIVDDNETFCIPDNDTFTSNLSFDNSNLAKKYGIKYEQALKIGYLTDEFARKTLEGQKVRLLETGNVSPNCNNADIFINDKSFSDLLKENDYIISSGSYKSLLEKAERLNLVILNHHSLKYHTLDCKYGKAAGDAVIIPLKDVPKESAPCKFCHDVIKPNNSSDKKHFISKNETDFTPPPPSIFSDGNIKLILTDYTRIYRPDKKCTHQVCREFLEAIKSASQTIDIATYGFVPIPEVEEALREAVAKGVKVRFVYDIDSNHNNYYPETLDFIPANFESRSDEIQGKPTITNMLMHNKFAIFDKHKVYTGSMNFSATGFSGFNHNNVVIINSDIIAEAYSNEFEQMYNGKFHTLKHKRQSINDVIIGNTIVKLYFSPQDRPIAQVLIPIIQKSKSYIYVPAFVITHRQLTNELIYAKQRGVDVKVILDATNATQQNLMMNELKKKGVPVKVENYAGKLHSKTMIIDDEYIIAGSTNFSNSGDTKNDENMLIIKNTKLASMYKDFFLYLWAKIPDKYLKYTVPAESKESQGSCSDGVDNDYDGKIDTEDEGCK